jgi:hypothetical protein
LDQQCCVGETTHPLKISLADSPDVDEGHIDGHGSFSSLSFDTTDRDDILARSDELFSDEANVKSSIEAGKKALEHVLKALEMASSDGHPFWQIVYDVWRLETSQCLAMSWDSRCVERADALLVLFFMDHYLVLLLSIFMSVPPVLWTDAMYPEDRARVTIAFERVPADASIGTTPRDGAAHSHGGS